MKEINYESSYSGDFFDISAVYLDLWAAAVSQQLKRLDDVTNPEGYTADFIFLVISLHNFELALRRHRDELWRAIGTGIGSRYRRRAAKCADQAIESFESQLPHIRDMRNIFSHLEEYAYGVGRLQASGAPLSVKSTSSNIIVVKEPDVRFELDLHNVKLAMDKIWECVIEIFVYFERPI
jgi:hypothetical protein